MFPSQGGQGGGFGQLPTTSSSVFGQVTSTTASSVFGGFQAPAPTSALFGGGSASLSRSVFGGTGGQTSAVFGQTGPSSSAVFSQQKASANPPLFGDAGITIQNPFGKSQQFGSSENPVSVSDSITGQRMPASTFGGNTDSKNVFGRVTKESQSNLFGGKIMTDQISGGNLFADAKASEKTTTSVAGAPMFTPLFGAVSKASGNHGDSNVQAGTMGERDSGDGVSKRLFGKPAVFSGTGGNAQSSEEHRSPGKPNIKRVERGESSSTATRGLFGKALSAAGAAGTMSSQSRARTSPSSDDNTQALSRSGQKVSRRLSVEELNTKTALIIKNMHPQLCNNSYLKKHFEKFGKVKRVFAYAEKRQATVHFATHEDAAAAKVKGRIIGTKKPPLQIFWSTYSPGGKLVARRSSKEIPVVSDIDDELSSMSGTDDIAEQRIKSIRRPEESKVIARGREVRRQIVNEPPGPTHSRKSGSPAPSSPHRPARQTVGIGYLKSAVAKTTSEKLEILSQYDKILRQGVDKRTDIQKAKIFVGTCQDMCPEKERYLREDRRRVHYYEMVAGTENVRGQNPVIDHARAVKEYSRASADQDEPLPHELRPGPTLDMSMTYLLNNILDAGGEGKWRDWYEFLWDRTRGIRKDITQQNLCDETAAGLVEKCARFHIFSAEWLCEEDVNTFDVKINNENLTKCLQTLKEIYHDLFRNKNATCPNEAEFRAYMVLMNLNEGDILREVQNLRHEIRNTPYINFVVQVYSALNSNNYVKFFKLAKKASFMMACIMHRYFNQVRSKALHTMLRAFAVGKQSVSVPLEDLVRQLAFEDHEEAMAFSVHHGLVVEDDYVQFDRAHFIAPETAFELTRAKQLIESKLTTSVGEAVNGAPLPPNVIPQPTSSFDDSGRFIRDVGGLGESGEPVQQVNEPVSLIPVQIFQEEKPSQLLPLATGQKLYSNEVVKDIAKELFIEVIRDMCGEISQSLVTAINVYMDSSSWILEDITTESCAPMIRDVAKHVLVVEQMRVHEKQIAEKERLAQEAAEKERVAREAAILAATRERAVTSIGSGLIEDVVCELVKKTADKEYSDVQCMLRVQSVICAEILDENVSETMSAVAEDVYKIDVKQRLEIFSDCEASIKLSRTGRYLKRWRNTLAKLLRTKKSMYNFPSTPNVLSDGRDILDLMLPERNTTQIEQGLMPFNKKAKLIIESPRKLQSQQRLISQALSAYYYLNVIRNKRAWSALDLPEIIGQNMSANETWCYWKLIVLLPGPSECLDETSGLLCDWICSKFSRGTPACDLKRDFSRVLCSYSKVLKKGRNRLKVSVCVRTLEGALTDDQVDSQGECSVLLGTSALLFLLPPSGGELDESYWFSCRSRLSTLFDALPPSPPRPLVIITAGDCGMDSLHQLSAGLQQPGMLDLGTYMGDVISGYEVLALGDSIVDPQTTELMKESIKWLSINSPAPPTLHSKPIKDYIEEMLAVEFYAPVYQDLARRHQEGLLHQPPGVLVDLYNSSMQHIQTVACSDSLTDLSWPIPELLSNDQDLPKVGWNSCEHLQYLLEIFESLLLPEFTYDNERAEDWTSACEDVWSYVDLVCGEDEAPQLRYRIGKLLKKAERSFEYTCLLTYNEDDCNPCYLNMPWTEIIASCIHHLLESYPKTQKSGGELLVHYLPDEYSNYTNPKSWRYASAILEEDDTTLDDTVLYSTKRKQEVERSTPAKVTRLSERAQPIPFDMESQESIAAQEVSRDLANMLAQEKLESDMFEKMLQNALAEGAEVGPIEASVLGSRSWNEGFGDLSVTMETKSFLKTPPRTLKTLVSPKHFCSHDSEDMDGFGDDSDNIENLSMDAQMNNLQQSLLSEKQADKLFEMKLQQLIGE